MKTKQDCLLAVIGAYRQVHGVNQWTTDELADWAMLNGLYPTPKRGDPPEDFEAFERRLQTVLAKETHEHSN